MLLNGLSGRWKPMATNARHRLKRLWIAVQCARPGSELHLEFINPSIGFFAQMNFCLYAARIAKLRRKRLFVTLSSPNYRDPETGSCWFHYFFEETHGRPARRGARPIRIWDNSQLPMRDTGLSLDDAQNLFFETFCLRPDMQASLDDTLSRLAIGSDTLGVHFRATDKHSEATPVDEDQAIMEIRALLVRLGKVRNLFVASDNGAFVARVHAEITEVPVVSLDDSARSNSDKPLHLNAMQPGNRALGHDALLNAMVLSRCGWLLRTTSFLSAWSSMFNPAIPVFLLNQPHTGKLWFPENRIIPGAVLLARG